MTKNEGRFPILWEPMHGLKIEISETDIQACYGLERIVLREMAETEILYPIIGADQEIDGTTWLGRKMAHFKNVEKPFELNRHAGLELINLLASIDNRALVGYSEMDLSYVLWPEESDIVQRSDFYN